MNELNISNLKEFLDFQLTNSGGSKTDDSYCDGWDAALEEVARIMDFDIESKGN